MTGIQNRTEAKDVFYTPHAIASKMVEMADIRTGDRVLEPCRGDGAIFDLLPDDSVNLWCEIALGQDFYQFDEPVDVVGYRRSNFQNRLNRQSYNSLNYGRYSLKSHSD